MKRFEAIKSILANSGHFYLLTTNLQGKYTYTNSNYASALSHVSTNLVGEHYHSTIHPEDIQIVESTSLLCVQHPGELFTTILRKHDGRGGFMFTQWEFAAMHLESSGELQGICCLGYNITKTIQEQNRLLETNNLLAQQKAALKSIGYLQSHVIRKPVANIQGLAILLSRMDMDPSLKSICSMILESSNELDGVIREVVGHANGNRSTSARTNSFLA